ncbi:MAG: hypothetical protein IJY15_05930, partial [Thermoguttaceae bacterium]|nr:hypothetical protein [Thermoguttaceae bacterium]
MPKNKRKSVSESAAEKKKKSGKAGDAKGMRTGVATLTICAAAFGAYYSPHFRTASSDWLERGRALLGRTSSTDESSKALASATDQAEEKWAQAPSFRDFLTDEYGEEGARELLGLDAFPAPVASETASSPNFSDAVAAESGTSEAVETPSVANELDGALGSSFADYVAAESGTPEAVEAPSAANEL